ncbi:protein MMS22-like [Glandiceps talaboti]
MYELDDVQSYSNLSGSITPPLSPRILADNVDSPASKRQKLVNFDDVTAINWLQDPVCFHCKNGQGVPWQPSNTGYLATGSLHDTLQDCDSCPSSFQDTVIELYGCNFVTATALIDHTQHLFYLTRQKISQLERLVENTPFLQRGNIKLNPRPSPESDIIKTIQAVKSELMQQIRSVGQQLSHGNDLIENIHRQCCQFLQYIKVFIYRHYKPAELKDIENSECLFVKKLTQLPSSLLYHIQGLITHLGSLSVLHRNSMSKELFHLHLDVHWSILEFLHLLSVKVTDCAVQPAICQLLSSHTKDLLWDLILIAGSMHKNVSIQQYHQSTIFPCSCYKEFWIQLIHLLDHRHQQINTESFWCQVYSVLCIVLEQRIPDELISLDVPKDCLQIIDVQGLCWWMVLHLAPLYQYDIYGQLQTNEASMRSNWLLIQDLLNSSFTQQIDRTDEGRFRCYLKCCIALTSIWEANTKIIVAVWEKFYRRLNDSFHIPGQGLQEFTSTKKSGATWFEECFHRCEDNNPPYFSIFNEKGNSFSLYLRLLAVQLCKTKKTSGGQGWRKIKGRFYSKFHHRGMQELTETGLDHFINLFLTLSMVADIEDVGGKMCDILDMVPSNKLSPRRRMVIWNGIFALILIYEDKGLDVKVQTHKLASQFNTICREFIQRGEDSNQRHQYWELLNTYLEGVQEVYERSTYLNLSEDQLIGDGFLHLLPVCKVYELQAALTCIQTVLVRHRSIIKRVAAIDGAPNAAVLHIQHKAIAAALWKNTYPFIKSHCTTMTPPIQLADIAFHFTLLAITMSGVRDSIPSAPSFITLVQYFGLQDNQVHSSICCQYLYNILPNQTIVEKLRKELGADFPKHIIHAWFRCVLLTYTPTEQMQELTRMLLKMPEFAEVVHQNVDSFDDDSSTKVVLLQFLTSLEEQFHNVQIIQEKFRFRGIVHQYLGDVIKYVSPTLKSTGTSDALNWMYFVCGNIVKYLSKMIYVQGKPQCLLPAILDCMVVPHVLFNPNKTMPDSQLCAIRETLHLFLEGLSKLDYKRDPYLQRRLKDIVMQYFHRFPMRLSSSATISTNAACGKKHPFLAALQSIGAKSTGDLSRNFRLFILELICTSHLILKTNKLPQNMSNALLFLKELFQRMTVQETVSTIPLMLGTMLDILLVAETTSVINVKKLAVTVLKSMLEAYRLVPNAIPKEKVETAVRVFIIKHFRSGYVSALHVLEAMAVMHKDIIVSSIPKLLEEVNQMEMKRGVGWDRNLRRAVIEVLKHLGEDGKHYIEQLSEDVSLF